MILWIRCVCYLFYWLVDCMFVVVFTLLTFLGGGIHHLVVLVMMRSVMFIHIHSMILYRLLLLTRVLVGRMELMFLLVLYYFCMYLCDDDICTDADIDEVVASCSLTDDDLELVAESM